MPVTPSFYVVLFVLGAISLASIYHSVLYYHRRTGLLASYCIYLWVLTIYIGYRVLAASTGQKIHPYQIENINLNVSIDATLLWSIYIAYVLFWGKALQLQKKEGRFTWIFYKTATPVIIAYIILENIGVNTSLGIGEMICFIFIRVYLGCFGMVITVYALRKRKNYYYFYLACGSISIIVSSLFSTYVHLVIGSRFMTINAFGWMMFGYFFDVIFFSAAVGYRLKEESVERLLALQKVIDQQAEINRFELEKIKAVYETREEERNRISAELHDDLGGGLSTIKLMSEMVSRSQLSNNTHPLEFISQKSQELIENINEIIWSLNNKADNLGGMIAYIRQYAYKYFEPTSIQLIFNMPGEVDHIEINPTIRRHVFLLLKECMHNILKHSKATNVTIDISLNELLKINISDNGVGIRENAPKGNGLQNMRMRINKLNGEMIINTENGTTITFCIPLDATYYKSAISNTHAKT